METVSKLGVKSGDIYRIADERVSLLEQDVAQVKIDVAETKGVTEASIQSMQEQLNAAVAGEALGQYTFTASDMGTAKVSYFDGQPKSTVSGRLDADFAKIEQDMEGFAQQYDGLLSTHIIQIAGAWSQSNTYSQFSVVSNNGSSYIARQNVPAGTPLTDEAYWMKTASYSVPISIANGGTGSTTEEDARNALSVPSKSEFNDIKSTVDDMDSKIETTQNMADEAIDIANTASNVANEASSGVSANAIMIGSAEAFDRNTYEGRALVDILGVTEAALPSALHQRIQANDYAGLHIGDYVDIVNSHNNQTLRYRIAAFDHDYQAVDSARSRNIMFIPDQTYMALPTDTAYNVQNGSYIPWNKTNTNNGIESQTSPYLASNIHAYEIDVILPGFPVAWRNVMVNRRMLLETRYSTSGVLTDSNSWAWRDLGKIWSLSEMEVYGCQIFGTKGYGAGMDTQIPIFREAKDRIRERVSWWLRSVLSGSSSYACIVYDYGYAGHNAVTYGECRPLPCFLVG